VELRGFEPLAFSLRKLPKTNAIEAPCVSRHTPSASGAMRRVLGAQLEHKAQRARQLLGAPVSAAISAAQAVPSSSPVTSETTASGSTAAATSTSTLEFETDAGEAFREPRVLAESPSGGRASPDRDPERLGEQLAEEVGGIN
jgi:hypothetical protein